MTTTKILARLLLTLAFGASLPAADLKPVGTPASLQSADEQLKSADPIASALRKEIAPWTFERTPIDAIFYAIGRAHKFNITVDPDVKGEALLRFNGGTLGDLVQNLLISNDLYMERVGNFLYIKKYRTEFYDVDYIEAERSSNSSSAVNMTPPQNNNASQGAYGTNTGAAMNQMGTMQFSTPGNTAGDASTLSIQEKSKSTFWDTLEKDIQAQTVEGEKVALNPFQGTATIRATTFRHRFWREYFANTNERSNAQVQVEIRIFEIRLNKEHSLGVDWSQLATTIGDSAGNILGPVTTDTGIAGVSNTVLAPNTIVGNFSAGKLSGVVSALSEQGNLRTLSNPRLRLMNNQKAYVKVGDDKTFWSLYGNINSTNSSVGSQTTTYDIYQSSRQTFGVVLPITAQISRDGWVTLVLEPAKTDLLGVDESPDGKQKSPNTTDKRIATIIRLRSDEATIIGGLTSEATGDMRRGVPLLSKLPLLGGLFRTDAKMAEQTEFLVTVAAHVIDASAKPANTGLDEIKPFIEQAADRKALDEALAKQRAQKNRKAAKK
jgi:type II secretory pathway component GspD/PulD (secretin)